MSQPQVLIVGAGPTGLVLALWLAKAGTQFLRLAAVRRAQFRLVSQVRITYRESSLSDGSAGKVRAGDRLPWVEGTDNFAPLASLGWQVHVYGTAPRALREFATGLNLPLHEWPWTPAARRAGLEPNAPYLVRPDGHVGFARQEPDIEALRAYLSRFGIAAPCERMGHAQPRVPFPDTSRDHGNARE